MQLWHSNFRGREYKIVCVCCVWNHGKRVEFCSLSLYVEMVCPNQDTGWHAECCAGQISSVDQFLTIAPAASLQAACHMALKGWGITDCSSVEIAEIVLLLEWANVHFLLYKEHLKITVGFVFGQICCFKQGYLCKLSNYTDLFIRWTQTNLFFSSKKLQLLKFRVGCGCITTYLA